VTLYAAQSADSRYNSRLSTLATGTSTMKHALALFLVTLLAQAGLAPAAQAQQSPWQFTADLAGVHQSESDLDGGQGTFAMDRWFAAAGVNYGWDARHSIGLTLAGGRSTYEFDPGTAQVNAYPWEEVDESRVTVTARFPLSERVTGFVIPTLRWNAAAAAGSGDSSTWGVYAAAAWWLNENLTLGPGLGVFSRLDDNARIFPILVVDWNITQRWNLSTGRGLAASRGPGLTLAYRINPWWSLAVAGRYEDLEFRLADNGAAPGGVGRHQSFPLVVSASLTPEGGKGSLNLFLGAELGGKLSTRDAFEATLAESNYDPALIAGVTLNLSF